MYDNPAIAEHDCPRATNPLLQHVIDVYASEINKVVSVWRAFADDDLAYRPHERSMTVEAVFKHQLLSERRFFGEFLSFPEPAAGDLARTRLETLAARDQEWWLERVPFFDVERERIWIFWRRVLHTAHHRTQLTVYLRLLGKPVPSIYGPTADVNWAGADPTTTVDAAARPGKV
jgi:uncharacterized damage-inducible protein DinB